MKPKQRLEQGNTQISLLPLKTVYAVAQSHSEALEAFFKTTGAV